MQNAEKIQELIFENSLRIERGLKVIWPLQGGRTGYLDMANVLTKYVGRNVYATNNGVLAFIISGKEFFVTTNELETIHILQSFGFEREDFYVPLSNGDLPLEEELSNRWERIRHQAIEDEQASFTEECRSRAKEKRIGELRPRFLDLCSRTPKKGLQLKNGDRYYPVPKKFARNLLGKYCFLKNNKGQEELIVFVNIDGTTWLTTYGHKEGILIDMNDKNFSLSKQLLKEDVLPRVLG